MTYEVYDLADQPEFCIEADDMAVDGGGGVRFWTKGELVAVLAPSSYRNVRRRDDAAS